MRRTSPCVSRIVNITSELWRLADRDLAKTFFVSPGIQYINMNIVQVVFISENPLTRN